MTQIDEITIKLSRIRTEQGKATLDLDQSMKELLQLTQQTDMYNLK